MSSTSRNKNLLFIIAALLLTNIAVLVYFLWIKQPEPKNDNSKKGGMTEMLKKEVGFNDEQVAQYKQLKEQQWATIRPMFDEMRKAKDSLFRLLSNPDVNDSIINKTSDVIAQKQKALDLQTFNHFKKVRALCSTPEQQTKYDSMVLRMFRKMGKQPARKNEQGKEEKTNKAD